MPVYFAIDRQSLFGQRFRLFGGAARLLPRFLLLSTLGPGRNPTWWHQLATPLPGKNSPQFVYERETKLVKAAAISPGHIIYHTGRGYKSCSIKPFRTNLVAIVLYAIVLC